MCFSLPSSAGVFLLRGVSARVSAVSVLWGLCFSGCVLVAGGSLGQLFAQLCKEGTCPPAALWGSGKLLRAPGEEVLGLVVAGMSVVLVAHLF